MIMFVLLLACINRAEVRDGCNPELGETRGGGGECLPCESDADCLFMGNPCEESTTCENVNNILLTTQLGCNHERDWPADDTCVCDEGVCQWTGDWR